MFGDSNVWGDEQPGCTIEENSQPSKTTFPYYLAERLKINDLHNYAVSGASLQLVSDSILFNFLPNNNDSNDLIIVLLPNCIRHSFLTSKSKHTSINDVIRYTLQTCFYNKNLKKDTTEWMMNHLWHEKALYYNVIKHVLTIDTFLKDYKNVFYFWNTRHHYNNFRQGKDGLESELKHRNNWHPTEYLSKPNIGNDVFDSSIIDVDTTIYERIKHRTIDWDIMKTLDEITIKMNSSKYKLGHYKPEIHKHYINMYIYEKIKEKLNVN